MRMWLILVGVFAIAVVGNTLPQFEAYWESQGSYLFNTDELHNPWYIDLGAIDAGPPGYLGGPSIVTIGFADTCVANCQESYPDEFCSKYPPEGIPARPRTVEDWGTKFNITSTMLTKGIAALKEKGTKINLSYGFDGLHPTGGGGEYDASEDDIQAERLAQRMANNVADWDLDGVDIFTRGIYESSFVHPGNNAGFHYHVFKNLRRLLPSHKTISYTILNHSGGLRTWHPMEEVIGAAHRFMDYINLQFIPEKEDSILDLLTNELGVPHDKIGWMLNYWWTGYEYTDVEVMQFAVNSVKERGLRGLSFFSVNQEYNVYRGEFLKEIAENLYS